MNLPFLRFFKKDRPVETPVVGSRPIVAIEKPASERFAKTFTPNSARHLAPGETPPILPEPETAVATATIAPPAPAILPSFAPEPLPASMLVPPPPRSISLGNVPKILSEKTELPGIIAERSISLALSDITLPEGIVHSVGLDPHRRVLFKAADVERGMSSGRPAVKLRAIYQQAPEIFTREIEAADPTEVALPFGKVLEQFASFHVRSDQIVEDVLPQIETPFLHLTLEDSERFGGSTAETPAPVPEAPPEPIPKPTPAPAVDPNTPIRLTVPKEAAEAAARVPIRLNPDISSTPVMPAVPVTPKIAAPSPIAPTTAKGEAPAPIAPKIPAPGQASPAARKISPNGTGVPAPERVPASSGSPVPTPLPSPLAPPVASPSTAAPAKIPFKITPPSNDLRETVAPKIAATAPLPAAIPPKITPPSNDLREAIAPKIPAPKFEFAKVPFSGDGPRIRLPLRPILRALAPFQLSGPTDTVAETATIELPFAILQPQLSLGKVSISPAQFQAALPAEYRSSLSLKDLETPIALPLQDILQNLPNESLKIRDDQKAVEVIPTFETPFSQKAVEDAARLAVPGSSTGTATKEVPAAPPIKRTPEKRKQEGAPEIKLPSPLATAEATAPKPVASKPAMPSPKPSRDPLQLVFDTDEVMDAKNVVAHASHLPGVRACAIVFSDGLSLAGNIPAEFKIDGLCAIAPGLVKKCQEQMPSANLGTFAGLTLSCTKSAVTFFAQGDICLAALHWAGQEIEIATRTQLSSVTEELARVYTQPPAVPA
jgi:predicted regulator of Ras-like GTPase activity (Roadblock/LC7/MglB family)